MNNTPTPKSDKNTYNKHQDNCPTSVVPSLICRQLERELTAARQELKAVTEQRDRLAEACSPSFDTTETDAAWSAHCIDPDSASGDPWDLAKKLETELTAVTEQRDELLRYNEAYRQDALICADCDAISKEEYDRAIERWNKLADLVRQFIYILDITEESDGGRLFHPTNITSCRAGDLQKAGQLVEALRRAVKGEADDR